MGEIWAAAVTVAGTAYAANRSNAAAGAQSGAAQRANDASERENQLAEARNAPWTTTGGGAENALGRLFGLPTEATGSFDANKYLADNPDVAADPWASKNPFEHYQRWGRNEGRANPTNGTPASAGGTPDASGFTTSPGYQFRRDEGTRGITNAFGAGGGAFSGNALKALAEFNSGLASQEFDTYVNQLNTIAGNGQQATSENNILGANAATTQGRNSLYAGDARASGVENTANIVSSGLNQLGGIAGYYKKKPNTIPGPYGN